MRLDSGYEPEGYLKLCLLPYYSTSHCLTCEALSIVVFGGELAVFLFFDCLVLLEFEFDVVVDSTEVDAAVVFVVVLVFRFLLQKIEVGKHLAWSGGTTIRIRSCRVKFQNKPLPAQSQVPTQSSYLLLFCADAGMISLLLSSEESASGSTDVVDRAADAGTLFCSSRLAS